MSVPVMNLQLSFLSNSIYLLSASAFPSFHQCSLNKTDFIIWLSENKRVECTKLLLMLLLAHALLYEK